MKIQVIINEQHTILPEQKQILDTEYPNWEYYKVPADGWDIDTIKQLSIILANTTDIVIFISPIPAMIKLLSLYQSDEFQVFVFHNDKREKKELPNGKIISVTAQTGWELV